MKEYELVQIVRDPQGWVYEALELAADGHFTAYRFDAQSQTFTHATIPAGAAAPHFFPVGPGAKVPVFGWRRLGRRSSTPPQLKLVGRLDSEAAPD